MKLPFARVSAPRAAPVTLIEKFTPAGDVMEGKAE